MRAGRSWLIAAVAIAVAAAMSGCSGGAADRTGDASGSSIQEGSATGRSTASAPSTNSDALAPGDHTISLHLGGITRTVLLHVPEGSGPFPLMLVYHGVNDTAQSTRAATDFSAVGDDRGILVAFLQGYRKSWNEGAGNTPAHADGIDDVAFTAAALQEISRQVDVDASRVAAVGFSNGALLTQLLGCRLADKLALIVPVEGPIPSSVAEGCTPARAVSVLEIHGTADTAIPYGGGPFSGVGGGTTVLSAPDTVALWARLDGCSATAKTSKKPGMTVATYPHCDDGAHVRLQTIDGGTHQWPGDIGERVADVLVGRDR